ncbi:hypothetical protein N7536_009272 [Penicillium majusculum]|uniref:Uncharacterized protein n=1 Tax=Penicillium solitum TaxID=60172 RepID=A0A1V6R326_9EURO|nr:uncharacterized protein PENSOL_c018G10874 [Penicillium solitum]KAJ5686653.1 hypothetical protein N7536_009272 [Penicillium majusculum]OQD95839.1 hypothetical protein PENSOL_c018G10874 [Penicillium solitum]
MDTGASRDPSKSLLPPVEGTGQKRRHSSLNDQVEAENPSEVSAKEAYRDIGSIKRANPLAVSKNGRNRQTFLPFDQIENTDQTAKAPQRASQNEEIMEAPQRAGRKDETKPKAPQRASQKQSVLDGFFSRSQDLVPRAPSPTTTGRSAEIPFDKSDKGPGQGGDDGWESDWVSDVNEKDDYSHVVVDDDEVIGDDNDLPGPEGEDCSVSSIPNETNVETSAAETPDINGQPFKTIREIVEFLKKMG